MNRIVRLGAVGSLAITAVAVVPGTAFAAARAAPRSPGQASAVFVQTDASVAGAEGIAAS